MKVLWNNFKLKMREHLRTASRADLNKPNQYMVKKRTFQDIDINKDFEKRLIMKTKEKTKEKFESDKINLNQMSLQELELYKENEFSKLEEEKFEDTSSKILVEDVSKLMVLANIRVHEFFDKNFEEFRLHPETKKNLEIIEYHLNYNLPIEKKILFETIPEMFNREITLLAEDERLKYKTRRLEFIPHDGVMTKVEQFENALINKTYISDKIFDMKMYHFYQQSHFRSKYYPFIQQALNWGWETPTEYLQSLWIKDFKKMTYMEKIMLREMEQLEMIKEEFAALEQNAYLESNEITFPFPMEGKFRDEYIQTYMYFKKFRFVKLEDTLIIPPNLDGGDYFDNRLRNLKDVDIEELIEKCKDIARKEYKHIVDSGLVYKTRTDKNVSDPEFNKQVQIISQAVKVHTFLDDLKRGPTELPLDYYEERLLGNLPTEGRILIEEYYKALYLNDQDPEKYNFSYWEDYFKVSQITLRNTFNYVFFPIPDEKNPSEILKILHFKDVNFKKRREFIAQMTTEEYKEYLSETDERPELQEIKRLEYIKLQQTAKQPRISERTIPILDEEIEENIDKFLINSDIMKEIDNKIGEFVSLQVENHGLQLDADVKLRLEEIKQKRILIEAENLKRLYENPEFIETQEKILSTEEPQKMIDEKFGKVNLITHDHKNPEKRNGEEINHGEDLKNN